MRISRGTRRQLILGAIILVVMVIFGQILGHYREPSQEMSVIQIHCGNSMRPAAEVLAKEFEEMHGIRIEFNYGGSESLLPQITTRHEGDIFITHDPFGELIKENGLMEKEITAGYLTPVIIVPKGNPKGIENFDDALKPGLRVGSTDPRYTTCARMVEEKLRERDIDSFNDHPNFVLQTRSHGDVATGLVTGQLDAGIVWNFIGANFSDSVDVVPMGEDFPETRVIVCLLNSAQNPAGARKFLDLVTSKFGQKVFADHGYGKIVE